MTLENQRLIVGAAENAGFDTDNLHMAHAIAALIQPLSDHSKGIDSGGGASAADLWITSGGVEYFITIRKSNQQPGRA